MVELDDVVWLGRGGYIRGCRESEGRHRLCGRILRVVRIIRAGHDADGETEAERLMIERWCSKVEKRTNANGDFTGGFLFARKTRVHAEACRC